MIKKKNNKKGFTLVELLAVIVILLAISVVAIPSISAGMERSKAKTNENMDSVGNKDAVVSNAVVMLRKDEK